MVDTIVRLMAEVVSASGVKLDEPDVYKRQGVW